MIYAKLFCNKKLHESENNQEFTRIQRKKFRLELISCPIPEWCWNKQGKSTLFLLGHQIFYSNIENSGKPMNIRLFLIWFLPGIICTIIPTISKKV